MTPPSIFHEFYQPGDFIIGQIVAHIFLIHSSSLFREHPKETSDKNLCKDSFFKFPLPPFSLHDMNEPVRIFDIV